MKLSIFLAMLLTFLPVLALNTQSSYEVFMTTRVNEQPDDLELPSRGNRTMPIPIKCIISENGISISNHSTEITSYGIYDVTGGCVAVFGDEESFIDFLFTLSGEYQLRFTTASYDLVGYIYL